MHPSTRHPSLVVLVLISVLVAGADLALAQPGAVAKPTTGGGGMELSWVPVEGTSHPAFASAGPEDALDVYLVFGLAVDSRLSLGPSILKPFRAWRRALIASSDGKAVIERRVDRRSLNVVVYGVAQPAAAVARLVEAYRLSRLQLSEVFLVRHALDSSGELADTVADPRMPEAVDYPDTESFWRAVFDPDSAPPPSEDPSRMASPMTFSDGQVLYETRGMPLYLPGVRIVYGTSEVEILPPDLRAKQVAQVLRRRLFNIFPSGTAPAFFDGDGQKRRVTRVRHGQRIGYSFAIKRDPDSVGFFAVRYPEAFRFREYELMRGVASAIERLGLEPVILWNRGQFFVLNVWERAR